MIRIICKAIIFVSIAVTSTWAHAQVVSVKAGDHEGFSRLVFYFQAGREWTIDDNDGTLSVKFDLKNLGLNDEGIFRKISRDRIQSIRSDRGKSEIIIQKGCDCTVRYFLLRPGILVVDVTDGSALTLTSVVFVQDKIESDGPALISSDFGEFAQRPNVPSSLPAHDTRRQSPSWVSAYSLPTSPRNAVLDAQDASKGSKRSDNVDRAREKILNELQKAISQGLLTSVESDEAATVDQTKTGTLNDSDALAELLRALPNARTDTAIDRGVNHQNDAALTYDGLPCLPDPAFDVAGPPKGIGRRCPGR